MLSIASLKISSINFLTFTISKLRSHSTDVTKFASYIYEELFKSQDGADINGALRNAHEFVGKFLKGQLPDFVLQKYRVMVQRILQYGSAEAVTIPNVRVLIYTDGTQFVGQRRAAILPNPFVQYPLDGLNHDILIDAYLGQENDEGCKELRSLLSRCPIHNQHQFFLFDNPAKIGNLKYLFRMASRATGFCPKRLEKELYR